MTLNEEEIGTRVARFTEAQPAASMPDAASIVRTGMRRRRRRRFAMAAAVVTVMAGLGGGLSMLPGRPTVEFASPSEAGDSAALQPQPTDGAGPCLSTRQSSPPITASGWSTLPRAPVAGSAPPAVATVRGLIVLGEGQRGQPAAARLDIGSSTWTCLPAPPLTLTEGTAAAAGDGAVYVWNGTKGGAAAFDEVTGRWRTLPQVPLSPRRNPHLVWTENRLIAWGGVVGEWLTGLADGALYDPTTDTWEVLPDAPVTLTHADALWTGEQLVVFGVALGRDNHAATDTAVGAAFDPTTRSWRLLAESPLSPQAASAAWVDGRLLAWDYLLEAASYDFRTDTWTPLPQLPLQTGECFPNSKVVDGQLLAWYCTQAALFDGRAATWQSINVPEEVGGTIVSDGHTAVIIGAPDPAGAQGAWTFTP